MDSLKKMHFIFRVPKIYDALNFAEAPHTSLSNAKDSHDAPPEVEKLSSPLGQTPLYQTSYAQGQPRKRSRDNILNKLIQKFKRLNKSLHRLTKQSFDNAMNSFDVYNFYQFELPHYDMDLKDQVD